MGPLGILERRMGALASRGWSTPWGSTGALTAAAHELTGAARNVPGWFEGVTDAALLLPIRCGALGGLAGAVACGNFKDEATLVAAAAVVAAFADALQAPLRAECDLPPALRRAMLDAHDRVVALSGEPVDPNRFGTVGGPRTTLRGIGASVAAALVLPHRGWIVSAGECPVYLLRGGEARRLSQPDTLASDAGYRAAVGRDPSCAIDHPEWIVTRLLGATADCPPFHVTRLDLCPSDRILLGNDLIARAIEGLGRDAHHRSAEELCREILAASGPMEPTPPGAAAVLVRSDAHPPAGRPRARGA